MTRPTGWEATKGPATMRAPAIVGTSKSFRLRSRGDLMRRATVGGALGLRRLVGLGLLFCRDEQSVDIGIRQGFGAGAGVHDEGGAAGSDPDEVVAHREDVANTGVAFEDAEIRL